MERRGWRAGSGCSGSGAAGEATANRACREYFAAVCARIRECGAPTFRPCESPIDACPDILFADDSTWTVGVLVQSNFGGDLLILGVPVGRALGRNGVHMANGQQGAKGSIMMVVATDAPLSVRNLERLAARAIMGLARTGSVAGNGSGDYVIAFSTNPAVRRKYGATSLATTELANDATTGLFQGAVEATEEAIYNSILTAETVRAKGGTVEALPVAEVVRILEEHRALQR